MGGRMKGEDARGRILDVAETKFRTFGIRRVTMDEIATDLRMSKKTLYKHFRNKKDLVMHLVESMMWVKLDRVREALEEDLPPRESFAAGYSMLNLMVRGAAPMFMGDVRAEYPELWDVVEERRRKLMELFSRRIAEAAEAGETRPEVVPEVVAGIMQTVVQNYMIPETFRDRDLTPSQAFMTWSTILAFGVFKDPPEIDYSWEKEPGKAKN